MRPRNEPWYSVAGMIEQERVGDGETDDRRGREKDRQTDRK